MEVYKQLSDVEWAYRDLKDVLALRPAYHKTDERVEGHIFVATLALFLKAARGRNQRGKTQSLS